MPTTGSAAPSRGAHRSFARFASPRRRVARFGRFLLTLARPSGFALRRVCKDAFKVERFDTLSANRFEDGVVKFLIRRRHQHMGRALAAGASGPADAMNVII